MPNNINSTVWSAGWKSATNCKYCGGGSLTGRAHHHREQPYSQRAVNKMVNKMVNKTVNELFDHVRKTKYIKTKYI